MSYFAMHFETINKKEQKLIQHNYLLQSLSYISIQFYAYFSSHFNQPFSLNLNFTKHKFSSIESYEFNEHEVYFSLNF